MTDSAKYHLAVSLGLVERQGETFRLRSSKEHGVVLHHITVLGRRKWILSTLTCSRSPRFLQAMTFRLRTEWRTYWGCQACTTNPIPLSRNSWEQYASTNPNHRNLFYLLQHCCIITIFSLSWEGGEEQNIFRVWLPWALGCPLLKLECY